MSQAFAKMLGDKNIEAYSAGSKPSGLINPKAIAAMKELGYDLGKHDSKSLDEVKQYAPFDVVVTMGCGDACPWMPAKKFKKEWSPYLAPLYALLEGLFVGAISAYYDFAFAAYAPNIIMNAVGLTFGTCIAMYLLYTFKIIKATAKFKAIVVTATAGIAIFYMMTWVLGMFGISIPFLHESSALGIGFSIFVVALAALNLILNFDMIENGVELGAPKYMEWYSAFGLLVVIVWLYLEILRLLSLLSGRD